MPLSAVSLYLTLEENAPVLPGAELAWALISA